MFEAEVMEFPGFADLPKREKSRLHKVWDAFQELKAISDAKGMLIPQTFAAKLLDVSPQRVHQMIGEGILETHTFNETPFVTEQSVLAYAKTERKAGRPCLPTGRSGAWDLARKMSKKEKR